MIAQGVAILFPGARAGTMQRALPSSAGAP
jgi:hypothetical protein